MVDPFQWLRVVFSWTDASRILQRHEHLVLSSISTSVILEGSFVSIIFAQWTNRIRPHVSSHSLWWQERTIWPSSDAWFHEHQSIFLDRFSLGFCTPVSQPFLRYQISKLIPLPSFLPLAKEKTMNMGQKMISSFPSNIITYLQEI